MNKLDSFKYCYDKKLSFADEFEKYWLILCT